MVRDARRLVRLLAWAGVVAAAAIAVVAGAGPRVGATSVAEAGEAAGSSCVACHTSAEALAKAGMDAEQAPGCVVGDAFLQTPMGGLGCVYCHGGDPEATDAAAAMGGDFTADPSDTQVDGDIVCAGCHEDEWAMYEHSLHNTIAGHNTILEGRACTYQDPAAAADAIIEEYGCSSCHVSCGDCHVVTIGDGSWGTTYAAKAGFQSGHVFSSDLSTPEQTASCTPCHSSGSSLYAGSVHYEKGVNCIDCHDQEAVMGTSGVQNPTCLDDTRGKQCVDCHGVEELAGGTYHDVAHIQGVACVGCHASDTGNWQCFNCHGTPRVDDYEELTLKLGMGEDGKIVTLIHSPACLDAFASYPFEIEGMNASPVWSEWSSHTVVVPEVDQHFCDRCHGEGWALVTDGEIEWDAERYLAIDPLPEVVLGA